MLKEFKKVKDYFIQIANQRIGAKSSGSSTSQNSHSSSDDSNEKDVVVLTDENFNA